MSASQTPATLLPGTAGVTLLAISITNSDPIFGRFLRGLRLTNTTVGPGSVAQLDAELGTVRLYRDNGNGAYDPGVDSLRAQATASGGAVVLSGFNQVCPAGATVTLVVVTDVPLAVRDGDALDLAIQSASDLTFDQAVTLSNSFPLAPAGSFPIDGMAAAQIGVGPVGSPSVLAGTNDNLALNVLLPANGYQADQLQQLAVVNTGSAAVGSEIGAVRGWVDDGDGIFDPTRDRGLGTLAYTGGNRWQLTGLAEPVPVAGLRLFFSVDVPTFATNGLTIRLALPTLGVGMASANDGPIDQLVGSPIARAVSTADRVTLTTAAIAPVVVHPGDRDLPLLHLAAENRYTTPQQLDHLTVTNAGVGGTAQDRDRALQSLTLRVDGNGDGVLGDSLTDPALASAIFTNGTATLTGFSYSIAPGSTRHFFVTGAVSLTAAADGDTLSTQVAGPLDVGLGDTTRVAASWPLDSHARAAVDGMVAAQIAVAPTPAVTLAPSDAGVLALDVVVPRNGHADDVLTRVDLVNLGTAVNTDIAELRLWRDGGDGVSTPGAGDDRDLGVATWTGAGWRSPPLAEALGVNGARIFGVIGVTASPRDSATVQLALPVNALTVASANDGPLDRAVASPTMLLISNSPLLAALRISPASSAVGQAVAVAMEVRNSGSEAINGVTPSALTASGSGGLTLQSGPTPASVNLAPGARDTLRWTYVASQPGTVRLTGTASGTGSPSGSPRQSLPAASGPHQVFAQATRLDAAVATSMPTTVHRGQTGVVPLTLRLTNGGGAQVSTVRFRAFRLALRDEAGAGIVPNQLLAGVSVEQGTTVRLARSSLESSGSEVDLTLATPVPIGAGESVDLIVSLDLLSSTTVTAFRAALLDSAWFVAEDANSGAPVTVGFGAAPLPISTGLARMVEPPTGLQISALPGSTTRAGPGQPDLPLLGLRLFSAGTNGITDDIRVAALAVDASDTLGAPLPRLADVVGWIRIRNGAQTLTSRGVFAADGSRLTLALTPALSVPVNTPVDLALSGDVAAGAVPGAFRLRLADSTRVDARDASTRDPVPVAMTSDPLPGPAVIVEARADTLLVSGTPRFPASVRAGDAGVTAITVVLRHPGTASTAAIRMDSLVALSRDESRRPLVPASYLARARVMWNGVEVGNRPAPPASGDATSIPLGGRTLAPGDSATLDLVVDFSATAPAGMIELSIFGDGLSGGDANLGTRVTVAPASGELPLVSGLTRIQAPPLALVAGLASLMPAALAGDGREVAAGTLTLTNPAAPGAGDISVSGLTVRAADRGLAAIAAGLHAAGIAAYVGGTPWASSGALTVDSTTASLTAATPLTIAPGAPVAVELRLVPRAGETSGSVRLGFDAAGIRVVQPGSALLQIAVQPAAGSAFPLWTEAGSFSPLALARSYSNFPNPFAAGREATSFAYYLRGPGRATLRLSGLDDEPVITLLDGVWRAAGMHQDDRWDGRNGAGRTVRNGVYIAELTVHYDDGSSERALRKVAVVR